MGNKDSATVLMMDDNPLSIRTVIEKLRDSNYTVEIATNINQAVQLIKEQEPDSLVIDLYAPGDHSSLEDLYPDVTLGEFNQGELLGKYAQEKGIPYLYLTANKGFRKSDNDAVCLEKNESDEDIVEKIEDKISGGNQSSTQGEGNG